MSLSNNLTPNPLNVANMNVTLFDLNETPTGYSAPPALFSKPSAAGADFDFNDVVMKACPV